MESISNRLGLSTMAVKRGADPALGVDFDDLARMVRAGYRRIEVGADYGPSHFDYHNLDAIRGLRRRYEDCGATIYSVHSPYGYLPLVNGQPDSKWNISDPDPARTVAVMEDMKYLIEAMAAAGAELLLVHFDCFGAQHEAYRRDVLQQMVELLSPHGIRLSIEAQADMSLPAHFIDGFDFPQVGLACDTSHTSERYEGFNILADAVNVRWVLASARGRLNHLHLSDTADQPLPRSHPTKALPAKRGHFSPGRGTTDWQALFTELQAIDYRGCFLFEVLSSDPQRFERLETFARELASGAGLQAGSTFVR